MDVEEQIRRRFDALAGRLREEFAHQLQSVTDELSGILDGERAASQFAREAFQREADERLARTVSEAQTAREAAERDTNERLARIRAEADARIADAEKRVADAQVRAADAETRGREAIRAELQTAEVTAGERLVYAMAAIDRASSLSEILDSLASSAGREASRIALLLVAGDRLRRWRLIGFHTPDDRQQLSDVDTPLSESGIIADAVRKLAPASSDSAVSRSVPSFVALPPGRELVALPLSMNGQVVAVLYADQGDVAAVSPEVRVSWPATLEILTRHAARALEAMTAVRAAQVLTERPMLRPAPKGDGGTGLDLAGSEGAAAEDAARRYARLLISEIKLYHEPEVLAGRRDRNLASRLGEEIAHARALYHERVPSQLAGAADIFQTELVRTLADGDGELLGVTE
jgi:hypothetical protein